MIAVRLLWGIYVLSVVAVRVAEAQLLPVPVDEAINTLIAAYPDHLAGIDGNELIWKDGSRSPIKSGRVHATFEDLLNHASILDQFTIPYAVGRIQTPPPLNDDPGRIRNEEFFTKMYGDCRDPNVASRMRTIQWMPHRGGRPIRATSINGIADRLVKISSELEQLPPDILKYATPSAGAFNCRVIAGTDRLSMHSFGAAIDLNPVSGDYWRWSMKNNQFVWRNRIPYEIVEVFERNGFIWGGKWYHFDTLHFEYRPEIISLARKNWPRAQ